MTVQDLYMVSNQEQHVHIKHGTTDLFEGTFNDVPVRCMDLIIINMIPSVNVRFYRVEYILEV